MSNSQRSIRVLFAGMLLLAPGVVAAQAATFKLADKPVVKLTDKTADPVAELAAAMKPGDVLRLKVYREPDLSGEFQVNERGMITLPRLGDVPVGSWPPDSLAPRLTKAFAEYLREPTIEVTVLRRISVTGSVLRPNIYPVDPTMSVFDALALAGGASPDGVRNRVELHRGNEKIVANLNQPALVANLHLRSGDQLYVPERSWLSRNTWLMSSLLGATMTFTTIMLTR